MTEEFRKSMEEIESEHNDKGCPEPPGRCTYCSPPNFGPPSIAKIVRSDAIKPSYGKFTSPGDQDEDVPLTKEQEDEWARLRSNYINQTLSPKSPIFEEFDRLADLNGEPPKKIPPLSIITISRAQLIKELNRHNRSSLITEHGDVSPTSSSVDAIRKGISLTMDQLEEYAEIARKYCLEHGVYPDESPMRRRHSAPVPVTQNGPKTPPLKNKSCINLFNLGSSPYIKNDHETPSPSSPRKRNSNRYDCANARKSIRFTLNGKRNGNSPSA